MSTVTGVPPLPAVRLMPVGEMTDRRRALVVTVERAWRAVGHRLRGLAVAATCDVHEATLAHWQSLEASVAQTDLEVVVAVGGGLAADAGKYLSVRRGLPLVVVPTALSVDAFLTATSAVRRDGGVIYVETRVADDLILDLDLIADAPPSVRAAGICDVLSIATGCWDWRFAHERGQNPPGMAYAAWASDVAQGILAGALDCAEAAGQGDADGLKTLFDGLALEVQLCNQLGHSRPEEGSEHYFAYAIENVLGHGLPHGDLVGPGIVRVARLQGQDSAPLERALRACHVPFDSLPGDAVRRTLLDLPDYCRQHHLPYGIAHTFEPGQTGL